MKQPRIQFKLMKNIPIVIGAQIHPNIQKSQQQKKHHHDEPREYEEAMKLRMDSAREDRSINQTRKEGEEEKQKDFLWRYPS